MIVISLKIHRSMLDELDTYAMKHNMNRSEMIRRAISNYLLYLRNRELDDDNNTDFKIKFVRIMIPHKPKKAKKKKIIKITGREMMIKRELPPPKLKFIKIEI